MILLDISKPESCLKCPLKSPRYVIGETGGFDVIYDSYWVCCATKEPICKDAHKKNDSCPIRGEEIVRCKDCIHDYYCECEQVLWEAGLNAFCSEGKRKDT